MSYTVIGTRPIRHDGVDKVTGRAAFGADLSLPGMVHGAILRSPHAHARITRIDTSKAEALPGVRAVVTSADLPPQGERIVELGEGATNMRHLRANLLADGKVLYVGHAVAAVAADTRPIADEAVRLIDVEYAPLAPVLDVRAAIRAGAPVLHEDLRDAPAGSPPDPASGPTNVAKRYLFEKGDVGQGFADSEIVVEREFQTATVHQSYIEPQVATALWNADDTVTVWTSTQGPFSVRQQTAELLRIPVSHVKVVPMEIGGGFGGKITAYLPPVAAALSRTCGRPVQLVMDRVATFEATGPASGTWVRVKIGVNRDGRILAGEASLAYEAGAFPGSPVAAGSICIFACYDIPHARVEGMDVCVNKPRTAAYRAPGSPQAAFATETVIDEICEQLGTDPIAFRLANAAKEGTRRVDGPTFGRVGLVETLEATRLGEHYRSPLEGPHRGRGVASGFWFNVGFKSSVTASVNADGTVSLVEGSPDIGGTRTSLAMQLAETLGIRAEDVKPTVVDTDSVGYTDVTGGSRVTFSTGIAVIEAARDIARQLVERAATIWDVDPSEVRYDGGAAIGPGERRMSFRELAARVLSTGSPIVGRGSSSQAQQRGAFATHCVDVEVDPELGTVRILRYTAAQDVGTAVHPSYVEGQIQGGVVQGIGWALNEEYVYDEAGTLENSTFLDYRLPTCYDVPMIDTVLVEVPDPGHPYGVRGVGEVPICPPPAAIANAIAHAVGVRMRQLPMSPPRLLAAILDERSA